ncbi:MAG TPA: lipid A biosynthesis protein [Gammaproteobacteria bacterium]|nr:lipid A biosynthesis protein [Gammaproteobacteria bacterium]HDO34282.1 lipid A biosynthesis protein [Chromatiales bacterium]
MAGRGSTVDRTAGRTTEIADSVETLLKLLSRLPLPVLHRLGGVVYLLGYYGFGFRRALTLANLRRAFPDKSEGERRAIARRCYRNFCDVLMETVKSLTIREAELRRRVTIANPDVCRELARMEGDRTVIFLAAHQCNWEWMLLISRLTCAFPIEAVYKRSRNAIVDRLLVARRSRFGGALIPVDRFIVEAMRRHPGVHGLALVADQTPRREEEKCWVRFLGQDTAFFTGPQKLAALKRAVVYFVAMRRTGRGRYEVSFERIAEPPHALDGREVIEAYASVMERRIRAAPADWLWMYNKWKYPKGLYE